MSPQPAPELAKLLSRLAEEGQTPHTLFIGCSDSRVLPGIVAETGPGELFVVRNVGAMVPSRGSDPSVGAAVEYAVRILGVSNAVVCGHSHCGAVNALFDPPEVEAPDLSRWLEHARPATRRAAEITGGDPEDPGEDLLREAERQSVRLQLDRLRERGEVQEALADDRLEMHGWHYRIGRDEVEILDPASGEFGPALEEARGPGGS